MNIQNKFKKANVIYKITKDYDLDGSTLIIPVGCTLDFQGGSFANGTIVCNNTFIAGLLHGFDYNLILDGSIEGNEILFDWWKCEKVSKNTYDSFINGNNNTYGNIPEISSVNRTIYTNHSAKYTIKFGNGIYPFDDTVDTRIREIFGINRHETLLWFPNSAGISAGLDRNTSIHDIWIESKLYTIGIKANTYPHAPIIKDASFISYEDHVFYNLGGLYGGLFQNLTVYSPANAETAGFYGFGSNSNVFINVVDAHIFFNRINTNKKGKMFSLFYNCSVKEYTEFNVTYSGFKYLFYYNYSALAAIRISIHDGTVEADYKVDDDYSFNRIVHIEQGGSSFDIKYYNVYRLHEPKEGIDFYLRGSAYVTFQRTQKNIKCFIADRINNEGDDTILAQTNPLDIGRTIPRIVIAFPKYVHAESSIYKVSESVYERYNVPIEWYNSYSQLPILQTSGNNTPIYLPDSKTVNGTYKKLKLEKELNCRLLFLDDESEEIIQIPIVKNHYNISTISQLTSLFTKNLTNITINIIADIDMGEIRQQCRSGWIFNFYGNLNNGTLVVNNSTELNNYKGNAIIDGPTKYCGNTASRPTNILKGHCYFDTTLNKPIWAKSITDEIVTWVDATGMTV